MPLRQQAWEAMYPVKPDGSVTSRQSSIGTPVPLRKQAKLPAGEEKVGRHLHLLLEMSTIDFILRIANTVFPWVYVIHRETLVTAGNPVALNKSRRSVGPFSMTKI